MFLTAARDGKIISTARDVDILADSLAGSLAGGKQIYSAVS